MDNQEGFDDGFDHSLEKRTIKEFFDKLFSPWCKAFPKSLGCPKPEEPMEEAPPATTPTPTPAPAPVATQPPAVVAPPPAETKPTSPPVVTQPPVVVAPPATTAPAVVKSSSTTSITPQPTKEPEQAPVSNPGSGSSGGSGQGNGSASGSGSGGADSNSGNAGNGGSDSGHGSAEPVGSDNDNNAAVPPPSVTSDKAEVQPTATSGSHAGNGFLPGKVLLAAPAPVASHSSESGDNTAGDESGDAKDGDNKDGDSKDGDSKDADKLVEGSQPSPTSYHSAIQHNDQSIPTTLSTAWIAAGTPTSIPSGSSGESTVPGQVAGSDDPWNPELNPTPGSTHTQTGGGATASETPAVDAPKTSSTGLISGIAGGVVSKSPHPSPFHPPKAISLTSPFSHRDPLPGLIRPPLQIPPPPPRPKLPHQVHPPESSRLHQA